MFSACWMALAHGWNVLGVGLEGAAAAWAAATAWRVTVAEGTLTGAGLPGIGLTGGVGWPAGGWCTGCLGALIGVPRSGGLVAIALQ